ncbi:hypothetical protein QFC19_001287 [Naganishia cerealis]|uniref:Uncharacterized protein n=1 Tax=Naganishia cerealis TaxID=610337 RepID=A0ACC2WIT0_9TREE|nr:hypothetical protein QFC19_001287 [Naganishia cerealis]
MLPPYLTSAFHLDSEDSCFPWTQDDAERVQHARIDQGSLLIDSMLRDAGIASPDTVYPPTSTETLASLLTSLLPIPRLERDLLTYYLLLDAATASSDHSSVAGSFARQRYLGPLHVSRIQGFWYADRGRLEDAVSVLARPAVWSGLPREEFVRECQDSILDSLASKSTPALVNLFLTTSNLPLDTPERRQHSVRALALEQGKFYQAWRYVRDLEFETDMEASGELDVAENVEDSERGSFEQDDEMVVDDEEKADNEDQEAGLERNALLVQHERRRLLAVILEAVLIPYPNKTALQSLLKLPIDSYEQRFFASYLLNTTTSLPPLSFSLLHDLLTLRMCARGQHALAVEIDRQVAERTKEQPQLGVLASSTEIRGSVQEMVNLLPEVQRKMLLVERDAAHVVDPASQRRNDGEPSPRGGSGTATTSVGTTEQFPVQVPLATSGSRFAAYTRPSFAPLSASTQLRQASNPKVAMYQALLRSTASSSFAGGDAESSTRQQTSQQTLLPSDHAPASSRRRMLLNASTNSVGMGSSTTLRNGMSVPFGGQQTQFPSSPFNFPPRVPIGYSALSASQNNTSAVYPSIRRFASDHAMSAEDGSQTPRAMSESGGEGSVSPNSDRGTVEQIESVPSVEDEEERAETPVARESGGTAKDEDAESLDGFNEVTNSERRNADDAEDASNQDHHEGAGIQPSAPTKTPRGKRTRPTQPTVSPPANRPTRKAPARTRKQKEQLRNDEEGSNAGDAKSNREGHEDDHDVSIPGAFPTPRRAKRKLRSSSQFEVNEESDTDAHHQPPQAKRSRKGDSAADMVRRATRSQSVVSQATTEADHTDHIEQEELKTPKKHKSDLVSRGRGQPQRRSARLSESAAPTSPAQSVVSEADIRAVNGRGGRARKEVAKTRETRSSGNKVNATPATRGVRTRRQAAALEEEEEEE